MTHKITKQKELVEEIRTKQKDLNSEYTKRKGTEKNLMQTKTNLLGRKDRAIRQLKEMRAKAAAYSEYI